MSSKDVPNLAAVIESPSARIKVVTRPIPKPGPHEFVVRNYAIAANPVDWKVQEYAVVVEKYPTVLGSDACGVITSIGSSVKKFRIGDRVTGFAAVIYNSDIDHGAWQTYTILKEVTATKIPDSMSFEEGSVFPMAFATAAATLFLCFGLPRPSASLDAPKSGLLIWGAASSVGSAAVQIAKNLGYKIFATASPKHHEYIKSLGAFEVFDYHSSNVVPEIIASAKSAGTPISLGFDAVAMGDTSKLSADILTASGGTGSKLSLVLPWPETEAKPEAVELLFPIASQFGINEWELGSWFFNDWLAEAIEKGTVVPSPKIEVVEGGIGAAQKVFDQLKAGVSGTKLVVKVD